MRKLELKGAARGGIFQEESRAGAKAWRQMGLDCAGAVTGVYRSDFIRRAGGSHWKVLVRAMVPSGVPSTKGPGRKPTIPCFPVPRQPCSLVDGDFILARWG